MRLTCQVQGKGDEAVIASQELKRFFSLHQGPKVICYSFTIKEVVHTNQEVPEEEKIVCIKLYHIPSGSLIA